MALASANVTVGTTAVEIEASLGAASRTYVQITNLGGVPLLIGPSTVTIRSGYPVYPGQTIRSNSIQNLHNENIYGIVGSGTVEVRILEAS